MATNTVMPEQQAITPAEAKPLAVTDNRPPEVQKFELQQRAARLFAKSGLFADIRGANSEEQAIAQAFVKISLGDSMGFNPAESMTGIDLIQGRVAVGSSLRAARMQRAGYSWDILQLDDKGCRLRLKYKGEYLMCEEVDGNTGEVTQVPVIVSFMVEDAARAGLIGKDNYKKNPRNMFFARAITNSQRWFAPGILGVDILSTEEAIFLEPPKDQEAIASSRVKSGTDAKADRLLEKYGKHDTQTVAEEPNITDKDTDLASRVEGETPEAGSSGQASPGISADPTNPPTEVASTSNLSAGESPASTKRGKHHREAASYGLQGVFGQHVDKG